MGETDKWAEDEDEGEGDKEGEGEKEGVEEEPQAARVQAATRPAKIQASFITGQPSTDQNHRRACLAASEGLVKSDGRNEVGLTKDAGVPQTEERGGHCPLRWALPGRKMERS